MIERVRCCACPKGTPPWGPFGHVESNGCCFQKLGRSSKASIYYFLAGSLRDLRGFARDADVQGRSHADEYGQLRPGPGGIGLESMIQARSPTPTLLIQGSHVIFVRGSAVGIRNLVPSKALRY